MTNAEWVEWANRKSIELELAQLAARGAQHEHARLLSRLATNPRDIAIAFNATQNPVSADVSIPLDTQGCSAAVAEGWAVRRLTPLEWERLQGFPERHTAIRYRKKPAADAPRYRAIGNSMAVPLMFWIGMRLQMVDAMPR